MFGKTTFLVSIIALPLEVEAVCDSPITDSNFQDCVYGWYLDAEAITEKVGKISEWDVSDVTDFRNAFASGPEEFNEDLSAWNVSSATSMFSMFSGKLQFQSDLSDWDVGNVITTSYMFAGALSFNSDLSSWDVSKVTDMSFMFNEAPSFNSDISKWDVSKVQFLDRMFFKASSFGQSLCWDSLDSLDTELALETDPYLFYCTNCADNTCGDYVCTSCDAFLPPPDSSAFKILSKSFLILIATIHLCGIFSL